MNRFPPLTLTQRPLLAAGLMLAANASSSLSFSDKWEPIGFLLSLLGSASSFLLTFCDMRHSAVAPPPGRLKGRGL